MNKERSIETPEMAELHYADLLGVAKFSSLSRDLFWSIFIGDSFCRWTGYNDSYWWDKVATSEQFQVRDHNGKRYRLNPETNEVFILPNTNVEDANEE